MGTTPGDVWAHTGMGPGTAKCRWLGPCTEHSLDRSIQGPAACAGVSLVPMPGPSSSSCLHARVTDISKPGCWVTLSHAHVSVRAGGTAVPGMLPSASKPQHQPQWSSNSTSIWHSMGQPWATRDIHPLAPVMPCHPAGISAKFMAREQISTIPEILRRFQEEAGIPRTGAALPSPDMEGAQCGDFLCWRRSNWEKGGKRGITEIQHSL